MGTVTKSPFKLSQFIVKEFHITREAIKQGKVDLKINPSGVIDDNSKVFKLILDISVKDVLGSFDISLTALGFFEFKNEKTKENLTSYFYVNAPAIIFPYIRAYISSITALSGLKAVNLPVMNLTSLKDALKANTTYETIEEISQ